MHKAERNGKYLQKSPAQEEVRFITEYCWQSKSSSSYDYHSYEDRRKTGMQVKYYHFIVSVPIGRPCMSLTPSPNTLVPPLFGRERSTLLLHIFMYMVVCVSRHIQSAV